MKKRMIPALTLLALAVALGAALWLFHPRGEAAPAPPLLYFPVAAGTDASRAAVRAVSAGIPEAEATPERLLELLLAGPADPALTGAIPAGTRVRAVERAGRRVTVDFSYEYDRASGFAAARADCCVALTLCGSPGVREVVVTVSGRARTGVLTAQDALLTSTEPDYERIEVALYFKSGAGLAAEYRVLAVPEGGSLPERLVRALIRGPETAGLSPLLPEETELLALSVDADGLCAVTLSDAFWDAAPARALEQRLVLDSLVASLTGLDSIQSVLLLDESGEHTAYGGIRTDAPLAPDPAAAAANDTEE